MGTPPMMKWGRQWYLWSRKTGVHRVSYAPPPAASAFSAACIAWWSSTPWNATASLTRWNMFATGGCG